MVGKQPSSLQGEGIHMVFELQCSPCCTGCSMVVGGAVEEVEGVGNVPAGNGRHFT